MRSPTKLAVFWSLCSNAPESPSGRVLHAVRRDQAYMDASGMRSTHVVPCGIW